MNSYRKCEALLMQMLSLQKEINDLIDPYWRDARQEYYRAIWIECAELADYVGWKWWCHSERNLQQVHLELVDIFHFGLCDLLMRWPENKALPEEAITAMERLSNQRQPAGTETILSCMEDFVISNLKTRKFDITAFSDLAGLCGMSLNGLFQSYVGKNALNRLRQVKGYQQGVYHKFWGNREDNEWLVEVQAKVAFSEANYGTDIFQILTSLYETHYAPHP